VSGVPSVKVLLGPSSFAAGERGPLEKLRASGCEVIDNPYRRKLTRDELLALLEGGVEGIIAGLETLDREVMERSSLRVISRCGSGMSNVDVAAARELGIEVYSTPDAPTTAVAELTVGALLSLLRAIPARDRGVREGRWEKQAGTQLAGKTVAVVGLGRIGRRTAALLGAFGTTVIGVDPFLAGEIEGIPLLPLDEALSRADVVALHSSGAERLLGERELGLLRPGAYLLNAGRGELVDEDALLRALDSGRLAGAWLDVFAREPYDGPLCGSDRVILTPHIGSYTVEGRIAMEDEAAENLLRGLRTARRLHAA
jgi:D-3-phosphoglycerate dehydrogenase / 2-oxoglutarate reductase